MKQLPYVITIFSLIVALTGLSPVMAADAGRTSGGERIQPGQRQFESALAYKLSPEQMDKVHAGANPIIVFIAARLIVATIDGYLSGGGSGGGPRRNDQERR